MKKAVKWALIGVPVLLVIVVIIVILSLDSIARKTIETQTQASTNLPAKLERAHIGILGGQVSLSGFEIGAPKGFSSSMFHLGNLDVKVSFGELRQTPIRVAEITVDSPKLVVEREGTTLNVQAAMDQMPKSEPSDMRLVIGKLQINNTQVVVRPNVPMLKQEYTLTLPAITVQNVGTGEGAQNGAAIKDVLKVVLAAMMEKLDQSGQIPPELASVIKTGDIRSAAEAQVNKQLQAATQQAAQKRQELQKEGEQRLQEGLRGLLGGDKKK